MLDEAEQVERNARRQEWMKQYAALKQAPVTETTEARQARMKQMAALAASPAIRYLRSSILVFFSANPFVASQSAHRPGHVPRIGSSFARPTPWRPCS